MRAGYPEVVTGPILLSNDKPGDAGSPPAPPIHTHTPAVAPGPADRTIVLCSAGYLLRLLHRLLFYFHFNATIIERCTKGSEHIAGTLYSKLTHIKDCEVEMKHFSSLASFATASIILACLVHRNQIAHLVTYIGELCHHGSFLKSLSERKKLPDLLKQLQSTGILGWGQGNCQVL